MVLRNVVGLSAGLSKVLIKILAGKRQGGLRSAHHSLGVRAFGNWELPRIIFVESSWGMSTARSLVRSALFTLSLC